MSEGDLPAEMSLVKWGDLGVSELPTGTVTLLLADVEGSTRLWQTQPEEMSAAVARLDRVLAEVVAAHGGVRPVEQGEGDSFVVAFTRAGDAVGCALALQRAGLAPIRLRIAVHTGDVRLRDEGNYIGPTINRTARLRDLAHGGQTVLSGAAAELVADQLPDGAWLTELGVHPLRDLPRPERVVQLCHPDLGNEFPPLRVPGSSATQHLPVQLTSFVGRGAEIDEVRRILIDNRLVTLVGAGGAGKTRLAVRVAEIAAEFRDGGWFADLAPVTEPDVVPIALARALGLPDQPGRSTLETVIRFVGDRQMLLVLDNCEHLLDAVASLIVELLGGCPALTLLATSREPTGVPGEVTFLVPSLSLADEAIELFADRARRTRPDFAVTGDNAGVVAEICGRLDGMPLAIELAAARVRALSLIEIRDSLHDRFRLLTGGARTSVRRQQTLHASVDWSHALLSEPERVLFRRLAVFVGGFEFDAAQAVAGGSDVGRYQVFDQLALLVDKSLVVAESHGGNTRYRLLETMRQYALEKLGGSGEADAVRARHRDYYTDLAALLDAPAQTGHQQRVQQAEIEIDNLRGAFGWSLENSGIEQALTLAASLQPLWLSRGQVGEGLAWLESALGDDQANGAAPAVWARAFAAKATLLGWVGVADNVADAERALTIARDAGDPALLVRVLIARGCTSLHESEVCGPYFAEAAEISRDIGDLWLLSQSLGRQVMAALIEGNSSGTARPASEEALRVAELIGDRFAARHCRFARAWVQTLRGDLAEALTGFREIIDEAIAEHDLMFYLYSLVMEAQLRAFQGDAGEGRALAATALEACAEIVESYEPACHVAMVVACLADGDADSAMRAGELAWQHIRDVPAMSGILIWTALAPLARGDLTTARRWADDVVPLTRGWYQASALTARARVEIAQDDLDRAERDSHDALGIAAGIQGYAGVPDILECLAAVLAGTGSHREAARLLGAADAVRQRMGSVRFKVLDPGHEAVVSNLRKMLGDNDFDAAWADGMALSTEEAIAYAQRGRGAHKRSASGWGSLTPTELDVVRLARDGLSNKDIGARLFVSPRTVQTHLTHVYTKLGLTSRVQLAQEAARHG